MDEKPFWPADAGPVWDESLKCIRQHLPTLRDEVSRLATELKERRQLLTELENTEETMARWRAATSSGGASEGRPGKTHEDGAIPSGLGEPQTMCDQIRDLASQDPGRWLRADDVIALLKPENPDSVRALLGYMARTGMLDKDHAAGAYRLAGTGQPASGNENLHNVAYLNFGAGRDEQRVVEFFAANRGRAWRGSEVAKELGITDTRTLRRLLRALVKAGTLDRRPSSRFQYSASCSEPAAFKEQAV